MARRGPALPGPGPGGYDPGPRVCEPGGGGLMFPLFASEQEWEPALRAPLYAMAMLYTFVGVNIISDKFMESIEVIASKKVLVRDKETGRIVTMMRWNDTIAHLTLLALGSSAPEIMLSCVEIIRNKFFSGLLGPSTIVGSAAFNLFVIVAMCILAVPAGESRQIKENGVFFVTALFSLLVYMWMVFIVQWSSPQVIDVWEGVVTLAFFPILIVLSYMVDIGYLLGNMKPPAPSVAMTIGRANSRAGLELPRAQTRSDDVAAEGAERPELEEASLDALNRQSENVAGIITFGCDALEVVGTLQAQEVVVPVYRRYGFTGHASCKYRTEKLTAVPGYDYCEEEGEVEFEPGVERADIVLTVLPKRPWEHSDQFQLILEGVRGGAVFDPAADGVRQDTCNLTVTILNASAQGRQMNILMRVASCVDGVVNVDAVRQGNLAWARNIFEAVHDVGNEEGTRPSRTDLALHLTCLPWKILANVFTPPYHYAGGWLCFCVCLAYIGLLSAAIIDFAELFGCVANIKNSITAITTVALGTSIPDLFASRIAAAHHEWADASIVNVTGSNSVNVLLGIGLPWTMASIYWAVTGASGKWKERYSSHLGAYPNGAFIVEGQDLVFSVAVFTFAACVALLVIRVRRLKCGGELGGPRVSRYVSAAILILLWVLYILLSVWKMAANFDSFGHAVQAIIRPDNIVFVVGLCVCIAFILVSAADLASGNWLR